MQNLKYWYNQNGEKIKLLYKLFLAQFNISNIYFVNGHQNLNEQNKQKQDEANKYNNILTASKINHTI